MEKSFNLYVLIIPYYDIACQWNEILKNRKNRADQIFYESKKVLSASDLAKKKKKFKFKNYKIFQKTAI